MAKCQNCGRKLHLTDWKPVCPGCGVNLVYFKSNEKLLDDSEKAEIEHAAFQPKADRARAAYFNSKLTIMRIVFTVLPVVSLLIPVVSLSGASEKKAGLIDIVKFLTSADIAKIAGDAFSGSAVSLSIILLAVAVVMFLVNLIFLVASLGKHGKGRTLFLYGFMLACGIGSAAAFAVGKSSISGLLPDYTSGKLFIGAYVYIALLIFVFALNVYIFKKGIDVEYKTCLIGGLPKEEYFAYVEQGLSKEEIRRKMLVALAELQIKAEEEREAASQEKDKEAV